jgi:hypothetical protein
MNFMNGLVGVAFIALNHTYMAHLPKSALADGLWLGLAWSATLQWSDLSLQWLCLTNQRLDQ